MKHVIIISGVLGVRCELKVAGETVGFIYGESFSVTKGESGLTYITVGPKGGSSFFVCDTFEVRD